MQRLQMDAARVIALGLMFAACEKQGPPPAPLAPIAEPELPAEPLQPLPPMQQQPSAQVALGARLFADAQLSADGSVACLTCHPLEQAGADGQVRSRGAGGKLTKTNTPTIFNVAYSFRYNWNGAFDSLEAQIDAPLTRAMGSNWDAVIAKLRADPGYRDAFAAAFADGITQPNVRAALAAYERTLVTPDAPFDRWLRGDANAIGADAREGYELFKSFGCASCHQGANVGGNMFQEFGVIDELRAQGLFRVPSLRNVARTAPYFHDGSATTLEEAIGVMARYQLGRQLPSGAMSRLVAFLESLNGRYPGLR
jgi:cytochrome c peroxidase